MGNRKGGIGRAVRMMVAVAAAGSLFEGAAGGTVVRAVSLKEMAARAGIVVLGRVVGSSAHFEEPGRRIVTDVRFQVGEVWKGKARPGDEMEVRLPGGEVGDIGQWVPGTPRLLLGKDYVLFLERNPRGAMTVIGLSLGAFALVPLPDGTVEARRDLADIEQVRETEDQGLVVEKVPRASWSLPLEDLRATVRRVAETTGSSPATPSPSGR